MFKLLQCLSLLGDVFLVYFLRWPCILPMKNDRLDMCGLQINFQRKGQASPVPRWRLSHCKQKSAGSKGRGWKECLFVLPPLQPLAYNLRGKYVDIRSCHRNKQPLPLVQIPPSIWHRHSSTFEALLSLPLHSLSFLLQCLQQQSLPPPSELFVCMAAEGIPTS